MSCIRVRTTVHRGGGIAAGVKPFGDVSVSVQMGGISAQVNEQRGISATLLAGGSISAYLVCEAEKAPYLLVNPVQPIWVTMTESGVYDIRSNTDWIIE